MQSTTPTALPWRFAGGVQGTMQLTLLRQGANGRGGHPGHKRQRAFFHYG